MRTSVLKHDVKITSRLVKQINNYPYYRLESHTNLMILFIGAHSSTLSSRPTRDPNSGPLIKTVRSNYRK
jgi:hypothetical protein